VQLPTSEFGSDLLRGTTAAREVLVLEHKFGRSYWHDQRLVQTLNDSTTDKSQRELRRFENSRNSRVKSIRGLLIFWIWDTELAANLACEEVGDFYMSGNGGNAAWIARLTYLLCFDPSSTSAHPKRFKCRMSSRRFTYTSSCSITILFR
jgi:hypothetical protein